LIDATKLLLVQVRVLGHPAHRHCPTGRNRLAGGFKVIVVRNVILVHDR
jgi:hypothetical protein